MKERRREKKGEEKNVRGRIKWVWGKGKKVIKKKEENNDRKKLRDMKEKKKSWKE